jgi:hypothetical protein
MVTFIVVLGIAVLVAAILVALAISGLMRIERSMSDIKYAPTIDRVHADHVRQYAAFTEAVAMLGAKNTRSSKYIDIVFEGGPGPVPPRFVEVEDDQGHSINYGQWVKREDGYWVLRIERANGS